MQLDDFLGTWQLAREIEDRRAGQTGRFTGRAEFIRSDGGLAYAEEGEMRLGAAAPMRATRRYYWCDSNGLIQVLFEDGRFFHGFDPRDPAPEARHDCPPDDYRVAYDLRAFPVWSARWEVRGPRKDYTMSSCYSRA
ncbi:DUF6314 family protein [Amaricoccus macauensis]|uniref:DUF6314 family protein n=1 Tax=Amaricoccus macauensis TaxID=57001 RepID=UPI003C7E6FE1